VGFKLRITEEVFMDESVTFFYMNAGWGYMPGEETPEQGHERGARELARAEYLAYNRGFTYRWSVDPGTDSSDFSDGRPPWALWQCAMYNRDSRIVASLHGIDFGRNGEPWGNNYRRVVEAELALEGLTNTPQ
jgi:hypothetical protein